MENGNFYYFPSIYRFVFEEQYCRTFSFTLETTIKMMRFCIDFIYIRKNVKTEKKSIFCDYHHFPVIFTKLDHSEQKNLKRFCSDS